MATSKHLQSALLDGEFELERETTFFARRDGNDCLMSPAQLIGPGVICKPVALSKTGNALLVFVRDTAGQKWFAWIHAERPDAVNSPRFSRSADEA